MYPKTRRSTIVNPHDREKQRRRLRLLWNRRHKGR